MANPLAEGQPTIITLVGPMKELIRHYHGATQVAKKLNIASGNVYKYALGTQQPSYYTCRSLAEIDPQHRGTAFWISAAGHHYNGSWAFA